MEYEYRPVDQDEWQALKDEAANMRATCPSCGCDHCKVTAQFLGATRQRPCQFLCFQAVCSEHFMPQSFHIDGAQLALA